MFERNNVYCCDVMEMEKFSDNSIDCLITSPPYFKKRDYGFAKQWGLEKTPEEYISKLLQWGEVCLKKLKPTGTLWVNLDDTYLGKGGDLNNKSQGKNSRVGKTAVDSNPQTGRYEMIKGLKQRGFQSKSLLMIPERFAWGMIQMGWIYRNRICWAKRNGMPFSGTDRFTNKWEYMMLFVKSQKYYFNLDGVRDDCITGNGKAFGYTTQKRFGGDKTATRKVSHHEIINSENGKNPGDVSDFWAINTRGNSLKHYATFNSQLVDKPIIAGCPEFVCKECGKPRERIFAKESNWQERKQAGEPMRYGLREDESKKVPALNAERTREFIGWSDCGCGAEFIPGLIVDPFCGTGTTLNRGKELGFDVIGIDGCKENVKLARRIFSTVENRLI